MNKHLFTTTFELTTSHPLQLNGLLRMFWRLTASNCVKNVHILPINNFQTSLTMDSAIPLSHGLDFQISSNTKLQHQSFSGNNSKIFKDSLPLHPLINAFVLYPYRTHIRGTLLTIKGQDWKQTFSAVHFSFIIFLSFFFRSLPITNIWIAHLYLKTILSIFNRT